MSEVLGWVALLVLVAGGFYGVMQSYRQDLDRLPRILSRLLVLPAAVMISHVFPRPNVLDGYCEYELARQMP